MREYISLTTITKIKYAKTDNATIPAILLAELEFRRKAAIGAIIQIPKNIPRKPNKKYPPMRNCHIAPGCNCCFINVSIKRMF